jgi:hypothetical protein
MQQMRMRIEAATLLGETQPLLHEEDANADQSRDHKPGPQGSTTDSLGSKTQQQ